MKITGNYVLEKASILLKYFIMFQFKVMYVTVHINSVVSIIYDTIYFEYLNLKVKVSWKYN